MRSQKKNGSVALALKISMWKMLLVVIDQLQKKKVNEIVAKVELDYHVNNRDFTKKLDVHW